MVGTCPCHALAVPSVGAQHCYAIQSVNPALSHLPFTLFQLPSPKKGSSAKNTHVGCDLLKQDFGFGLLSCPGRAATAWCSQGGLGGVGVLIPGSHYLILVEASWSSNPINSNDLRENTALCSCLPPLLA